jgi:hypothetical protein
VGSGGGGEVELQLQVFLFQGLHFFPSSVTEDLDQDLLWEVLPELLQDVDLQAMIHLWFM